MMVAPEATLVHCGRIAQGLKHGLMGAEHAIHNEADPLFLVLHDYDLLYFGTEPPNLNSARRSISGNQLAANRNYVAAIIFPALGA